MFRTLSIVSVALVGLTLLVTASQSWGTLGVESDEAAPIRQVEYRQGPVVRTGPRGS